MDWLQIVVLALVQGLTEFLPISSSAHLVLPAHLTDWPDQGLAFDVGVHFGTLIAVVAYFRVELLRMAQGVITFPAHRQYSTDIDLVLKLGLATLPVAVVGFVSKDIVETHLRTIPVIAAATTGFALLLWYADRRPRETTSLDSETVLGWGQAGFVGLMQVLALIPGTSRSGITITAALLAGLSRTSAARFSFLLSIPTITGAQLLLTLDLLETDDQQRWFDLISGAVLAGLSAYLCIHFFIALVERTGMLPYVIYRLILGGLLVGLYIL